MDYRVEDSSSGEPNVVISGVPFEKPISEVIEEHPELMTPPERSYYDFAGWYLDPGCTKKAEFSEEIMPAANKVYYAKWVLKHYMVEIDPDGGEMQAGNIFSAYTTVTGSGAEITYNRVQYGTRLGRRRESSAAMRRRTTANTFMSMSVWRPRLKRRRQTGTRGFPRRTAVHSTAS